jgi:hypothetical protein
MLCGPGAYVWLLIHFEPRIPGVSYRSSCAAAGGECGDDDASETVYHPETEASTAKQA